MESENIALFEKILTIARRKFYGLGLRIVLPSIGLFGPGVPELFFKGAVSTPILGPFLASLWLDALQRGGRKIRAVNWADWVCARRPRHLGLRILLVEALINARCFDEATTALARAKELLITGDFQNKRLFLHIMDTEAVLAIERGDLPAEAMTFAIERDAVIANFCYMRAWDAHSVLDGVRVQQYLNYYFRAVNYDPDLVFDACDRLMIPNALWQGMIASLERVEAGLDVGDGLQLKQPKTNSPFRPKKGGERDKRSAVRLRLAEACLESGDFIRVREILAPESKQSALTLHLAGLLKLYEKGKEDPEAGRALLSLAYADSKITAAMRAELAGEIAISYEEARDFVSARQYYISSFHDDDVPYYLPGYLWRYVSLCMAQGEYAEAAVIMREALCILWKSFRPLARVPIEKRLRRNGLIPKRGAFIIGCWGIGDDIIRMAMFDALYKNEEKRRFGLSVDPRMRALYARSFPYFEIVPISRMTGPFAVGESEHVRLREGVSPALDRGRLDINVLKATRRFPDVALTEDMMLAFVQAGPQLRRMDKPLFKVLPEKQDSSRRWLATLPHRFNVGISWRSGQRDVMRNKSYTDIINDWGDILALKGINFINLQYSWEVEELRDAETRHGCVIHTPPFDLKDDIESIVALGTVLNVVLAPCTAVREMCAAAGANVWSLTVTPILPDLWRLDGDSRRDRLFPNMIHVTTCDQGSARGVLKEIARRLAAMVASNSQAVELRNIQ